MSALLEKFQSSYRVRVDPLLAGRWDYDARRNGEKNIKLQIAQARRTAKMLRPARREFSKGSRHSPGLSHPESRPI